MHRVELKAVAHLSIEGIFQVPNAPCGVESISTEIVLFNGTPFLMHRVELKAYSRFTSVISA